MTPPVTPVVQATRYQVVRGSRSTAPYTQGDTVTARLDFGVCFQNLTGNPPFPWQRALYDEYVAGRFPDACDIPTGLGKSSVVAVWLLALVGHAVAGGAGSFPRRLVYVVNRRTVVDQATREVERLRQALTSPAMHEVAESLGALAAWSSDAPLAISTLRGQFADNGEWRNDPARAAVVVGTVDMVGSRLLFSGYGCGFKSRPLHAGFIGHDSLLVHDEAHLEPAFQALIEGVVREQRRSSDKGTMRVMALTATTRSSRPTLQLSDADLEQEEVRRRVDARKGLRFHSVAAAKDIPDEVARLALTHLPSKAAILIYLRRVEHVDRVTATLRQIARGGVVALTGTLRGYERDVLARENPQFARFLPSPSVSPQTGTVFLVCTSAGEVGVNLSADHLVCDLTPYDSMAQRLGRVNRFGRGDAVVDVVHAHPGDDSKITAFDDACERTLNLLHLLPKRSDGRRDGSPAALGRLPESDRLSAFTPVPTILEVSDILFDAWSMTSIREPLPGRPGVADWLHGVAEWEPPETHVGWREEVALITGALLERYTPADLLDDYPLKSHELLRDRSDRVLGRLRQLATSHPDLPVWLVDGAGLVTVTTLAGIVDEREGRLHGLTVLLPPRAGGLSDGLLSGTAPFDTDRPDLYDIADRWTDEGGIPWRIRLWDDDEPPAGMRLVRVLDTRLGNDEDTDGDGNELATRRYWCWYVRPRVADDDGSRTAGRRQLLGEHRDEAGRVAGVLADRLRLGPTEAAAVCLAARWHDAGKDRAVWQRSVGNHEYPVQILAKSGGRMRPVELNDYRHEFGSLHDVRLAADWVSLPPDVQDLVLHLIAAHHGRARPHFGASESFDPILDDARTAATAAEIPARFARLQRRYGRWGLAYLESLVRAADALASQFVVTSGTMEGSQKRASAEVQS